MNLKQLVTFTAGMFLLTNCSTEKGIVRTSPDGHITGITYEKINQSVAPYGLEKQVLYNEGYYLNETKGHIQNSLDVLFYPEKDTLRQIELDSGKVSLIPRKMYLPKKVIIPGTKNDLADYVLLDSTGDYAIKADIPTIEKIVAREKIQSNKFGYKIYMTENDAAFAIRTVKIKETEYFFPLVENNKINDPNKLSFYLVPVIRANIIIDERCGNITLVNEDNIYRGTLVGEEDLVFSTNEGSQAQEIGSFTQEPTARPTAIPTSAPINREELEAVPTTIWN